MTTISQASVTPRPPRPARPRRIRLAITATAAALAAHLILVTLSFLMVKSPPWTTIFTAPPATRAFIPPHSMWLDTRPVREFLPPPHPSIYMRPIRLAGPIPGFSLAELPSPVLTFQKSIDAGAGIGPDFPQPAPMAGKGPLDPSLLLRPAWRTRCNHPARIESLQQHGGALQFEAAIDRSLDWLQQQQNDDGSWGRSDPVTTTAHLVTQALFHAGGPWWRQWTGHTLPGWVHDQQQDGSWPARDTDTDLAGDDGPLVRTALTTLCLQVCYRYPRPLTASGCRGNSGVPPRPIPPNVQPFPAVVNLEIREIRP